MSIITDVREAISKAFKAGDKDTTSLLRVVVGEVQQKGDESDAAVEAIMRKMIKNNNETISVLDPQSPDIANLNKENSLLDNFLPKTMTEEEVVDFITAEGIDVAATKSVGQAVGLVMKAAKKAGKTVQGNAVKAAVERLR